VTLLVFLILSGDYGCFFFEVY